ncbi:MAG: response regulator transcription factor [Microcystis aeruginosa K13-05]|jgi:DNA-binding NarL/FixJ family response regulator|uniref:Response regulator transcription factor n=1 Tax=Microcystis flos-aquae FACHB-1344 TaxID=2692899 RepID=A0ABR8HV12_9CHRO|nr:MULTISPECIES: response regulator transcription factor [Microcystis]MCE2663362.1 response regulator transcription factor [Microcystis sp. 53602_E8]MCZ8192709.1 response regulator transcription factor [Microcystis sp. LE19-338.1B]MCZ8356755.1 response regulator transcription factor [Microcystis sp. LE19-388.1G]MCZ8361596.1 response regulator transcription factor [Microcystis sp. LE19-251.1A]MDJ0563089.1 response regulator transcription factor [Microcystis sp. M49629_WE12]NCR80618.1 response 
MRILIVEDDPLMQLGLEQALSEQPDFEIVGQASDGLAGVQLALSLRPDLVVMDIGLPRLDGIAATKQIKEGLANVHVVMLTSHTLQQEVIAALASGADAYCIKGASLDRLLAAIEAAKDGATYLDPQIARLVMDNLKAPAVQPNPNLALLSEREMEVLKLIVEGKSNAEIAEQLYLSTNTIKTHVRGIMNKLAVDDRVQAAVIALRSGIV